MLVAAMGLIAGCSGSNLVESAKDAVGEQANEAQKAVSKQLGAHEWVANELPAGQFVVSAYSGDWVITAKADDQNGSSVQAAQIEGGKSFSYGDPNDGWSVMDAAVHQGTPFISEIRETGEGDNLTIQSRIVQIDVDAKKAIPVVESDMMLLPVELVGDTLVTSVTTGDPTTGKLNSCFMSLAAGSEPKELECLDGKVVFQIDESGGGMSYTEIDFLQTPQPCGVVKRATIEGGSMKTEPVETTGCVVNGIKTPDFTMWAEGGQSIGEGAPAEGPYELHGHAGTDAAKDLEGTADGEIDVCGKTMYWINKDEEVVHWSAGEDPIKGLLMTDAHDPNHQLNSEMLTSMACAKDQELPVFVSYDGASKSSLYAPTEVKMPDMSLFPGEHIARLPAK